LPLSGAQVDPDAEERAAEAAARAAEAYLGSRAESRLGPAVRLGAEARRAAAGKGAAAVACGGPPAAGGSKGLDF
jgi:elongator complex protein 4